MSPHAISPLGVILGMHLMTNDSTVLEVNDLVKVYKVRSAEKHADHKALDGVTFRLSRGGSLAVVGESGSGKSTCARIIVGLERATSGTVLIDGALMGSAASRRSSRERARRVQMVFQDPYSSLDPMQRVGDAVAEVIRFHRGGTKSVVRQRMRDLMQLVGLDERHIEAFPSTLSGGQRQRVAIARALGADPQILILDEAVAALDVSIQAQVLTMLTEIRAATGVAFVFITHDLAVADFMCDDVLVMKNGVVVESGPCRDVLFAPTSSYAQELLAAIPRRGWRPTKRRESHDVTPTDTGRS